MYIKKSFNYMNIKTSIIHTIFVRDKKTLTYLLVMRNYTNIRTYYTFVTNRKTLTNLS